VQETSLHEKQTSLLPLIKWP